MCVATASQLNEDSYMTLDQLAETGILPSIAVNELGFGTAQQLLDRLDRNNTGKVTFLDLVYGLMDCAEEMCRVELCNPHAVLYQMFVELHESPPVIKDSKRLPDRQKFRERYDHMVASFVKWKHFVPDSASTDSRLMEVIRGCFAGAEIPQVVDALRIVYMDYAGLRLAAGIIFALVSSRMKNLT